MNKNIILSFVIIMLAACQSAPATTQATIEAETQPPVATEEVATSLPTEIPASPTREATATPKNIKISSKDGMTQLFVPSGIFFMGGMDVYRENDEQPAHEVTIAGYWMDQVEVVNAMYALCVNQRACRAPTELRSNHREEYFGNPEFDDYPVVYVTWVDANAYCQWAGRRLPTEAEWERAARGDDKRNFPWGDELPSEYTANFMNLIGDTSRVGSYAEGASPFGVLDMAGNVWEWVADRYKPNYYQTMPTENPQGPSEEDAQYLMRVIRGGSYQDDGYTLRLANRNFIEGPDLKAQPEDNAAYGKSSPKIGFRCAEDG